MAEISSTQQVAGSDGSEWTVTTTIDTVTGNKNTVINNSSGAEVTSGTPDEVIGKLKSITQNSLTVNAINVISNQSKDLAASNTPPAASPGPADTMKPMATDRVTLDAEHEAYLKAHPEENAPGKDPVTAEVVPAAATVNNDIAPEASDDSGNDPAPAPVSPAAKGPQKTATNDPELNKVDITSKRDTEGPSKRQRNPLGNFASSTYQASLYMIAPDAYHNFKKSDRKKLKTAGTAGMDTDAVIVAQSGGINNDTSTRPPGFELDYYIDNLKIKNVVNGPKVEGTPSIATSITFDIIEPYGFSFITKLKKAAEELQKKCTIKNYSGLKNPGRQFFILGIRFQGYDETGKPVTAKDTFALDPNNADASGVFERFYDIFITSIKFKIDGKSTQYSCTASSIPPQVGFSVKHGRIPNSRSVIARTVADAIGGPEAPDSEDSADIPPPSGRRGILDILNEDEKELAASTPGRIANEYRIRWLGPIAKEIANSPIVNTADTSKVKTPMGNQHNVIDTNVATDVSAVTDMNKRTLTFKNDTSIMQAISSIILNSDYLEKAMSYVPPSEPGSTSNSKSDAGDQTPNPDDKKILRWYNLSVEIKVLAWDTILKDFAYRITFVIQSYEVPAAIAHYGNSPQAYYGPHKKYDYWYTGQNSEIIRYEQVLNNSYFNVVFDTSTAIDIDIEGASGIDVPIATNKSIGGDTTTKLGAGAATVNNFVTNLNDPGSYATAKIQILGDPDFLMSDSPSSVSQAYDAYYGTDGTINPLAGQVFIEIDFKEGKDYAKEDGSIDGLMDINSSIMFWKYPPRLKKLVHGVSYMVLTVMSTFSKGSFTQEVVAALNTFPNWVEPKAEAPVASNALTDTRAASGDTSATPATVAAAGLNALPVIGTSSDDEESGT